ncbi:MAG: cytochrome P450 [Oligoflexia bacterium]|nr:cytochrome P450 [Oligoflexia bacterium]
MANKNKRSAFSKATKFVNLSGIPGPRGVRYFNYVRFFQKNILGAFTSVNKDFGEIGSFPWPMNSVIIYSPKLIKQVLVDDNRKYIKGEQIEEIRAVVGNGLATNNNYDSWLKSRKLMAREFNKKSVQKYFQIFSQLSEQSFESLDTEVDICETMKKLTFDIACQTILGKGLSQTEAQQVNNAVHYTSIVTYERIFQFFPLPYWMPTIRNFKFNKHFRNLNRIVKNIIKTEKENSNPSGISILEKLVHAKDEETGFSYSKHELRDEILTLLIAGHETSAHTLTWAIGLLAKHQDIQERLFNDIKNETLETIAHHPYLLQVLKETMRLYPAFPVLSRKANENTSLGQYHLEKETNVVIPIYVTQRSEEYWDDPLKFDPDRFNGEAGEKLEKSYQYLPFSRGPRRCIAELFAMDEMCIIVFELLKKYRIELKSEFPQDEAYVSLKPIGGMHVCLKARVK